MLDIKSITYSNTYKLKVSVLGAFRQLWREVYQYRSLIWQYIRRDFVASYRGSALGIVWKFILPLVPMSIYVFLQIVGVFSGGVDMPRALYVVIGFTFYELWSSSLSTTMNRFRAEANLVQKVKLPMIVVYLTGLGPILFDVLVRYTLIVLLLLVFKMPFHWSWFLLPLLGIPHFIFGVGLGMIFSFFVVFMKDLQNIVMILVRYGLFFSCVIFPISIQGEYGFFLGMNPMYYFIEDTRNFLVYGTMETWKGYSVCFILSVVICLFALKKLVSLESRIIGSL